MKEIAQTLHLLANGPASYILREMKSSEVEIDEVCRMFPSKQQVIEPEANAAKKEIHSIIGTAQQHVLPLEHTERDIRAKESKPGLKRYFGLQKRMNDAGTSDYEIPSLQREANSLKAAFSRELVELMKKSHEALSLRLYIIEGWKDVVSQEIIFFETVQLETLSKILHDAHREGLVEIVDQIHKRLKVLNRQAVLDVNRIRPAELKFTNIKNLQSSLKKQLVDAVQLEKIIMDKYDVLQELSSIENQLSEDLPEAPSIPAGYQHLPVARQSGIRSHPIRNRMAFTRFQSRTA